MENIIQQLKDNEKPFVLMSEEMQKKAKEIGPVDFLILSIVGIAINWPKWNPFCGGDFVYKETYRLRPDYEEEGGIRQMEIASNNSNCLCMYNDEGQSFGGIATLHDRPDFIGFKFADGTVMGSPVKYSVPGITLKGYYASYKDLKTGQALEHHATHVLFRQKPKE